MREAYKAGDDMLVNKCFGDAGECVWGAGGGQGVRAAYKAVDDMLINNCFGDAGVCVG